MKNLNFNSEVKKALQNKKPVLALESTIISHGLPYPDNVECALLLEKTARENGATPATIAIINGKIKIGITKDELVALAKAKGVFKVSRADIPYVTAKKLNGATTVAATMILADMAGIKVFSTGGIGGVHRGAEKTWDVSADLEELAQTPVAVISAGAKAILDIPKTLEYLETKGVGVIGYKTDSFPLFYTAKSSYALNQKAESVKELALILKEKFDTLKMKGGFVIANPIPKKFEFEYGYINKLIEKTIIETKKKNILGKKVTPYILSRISELTKNKSVAVNIELVKNNVRLGARLAAEYSKLKK